MASVAIKVLASIAWSMFWFMGYLIWRPVFVSVVDDLLNQ